jgi:hypothetical protein
MVMCHLQKYLLFYISTTLKHMVGYRWLSLYMQVAFPQNHCEYWKCINQEMHCMNTERSREAVENDVRQNGGVN